MAYTVHEEIRQTVTLFVSQNWQRFFEGHTFRTRSFSIFIPYIQLNNRKRSCDIVLEKNPFFLWEYNVTLR